MHALDPQRRLYAAPGGVRRGGERRREPIGKARTRRRVALKVLRRSMVGAGATRPIT